MPDSSGILDEVAASIRLVVCPQRSTRPGIRSISGRWVWRHNARVGERYEEYLYNPVGGVYAWAFLAICACWVAIDLRRRRRPWISVPLTAAVGVSMLLRLDITVALAVVFMTCIAGYVLHVATDGSLTDQQRRGHMACAVVYVVFFGTTHFLGRYRPQVVSIKGDSVIAARGPYVAWIPRQGLWVTVLRHQPGGREVWMVRSGGPKPRVVSIEADGEYRDRAGLQLTGGEVGRRIAAWAHAVPTYKEVKDEGGVPPSDPQ